jgi:hypothetical protein
LGNYLVYLGCSIFDADWNTIRFKSVSAYSIGKRVFDLPVMPPAPLGFTYQREITSACVSRMVNGIYCQYDSLKVGTLCWAYWHALCATMHIAAAHFGAAIEALIRNFVEARSTEFETKLVPDHDEWRSLCKEIQQVITRLAVPDETKRILISKLGSLNETPRSVLMNRALDGLDIQLSEAERHAWRRRDYAAHGIEIKEEDQLKVIQQTKLLQRMFHRLFLKVTDGSDIYNDYCSLGFPIRKLSDPGI